MTLAQAAIENSERYCFTSVLHVRTVLRWPQPPSEYDVADAFQPVTWTTGAPSDRASSIERVAAKRAIRRWARGETPADCIDAARSYLAEFAYGHPDIIRLHCYRLALAYSNLAEEFANR
jgi:hypothetical protein